MHKFVFAAARLTKKKKKKKCGNQTCALESFTAKLSENRNAEIA